MTDFPSPSARSLLRHVTWVQALAKRLVADESLADDLTQEACVAALENPPSDGRPLRRWLGGVVRNLARQERRTSVRRAVREGATARAEATRSTFDVVDRAATQRSLVAAVLDLEEPYRTTVLLRFFDDLPQREIAQRTGVSAATVNSRLTRGLAKLRARLDRDHGGDGKAWLAALVPVLPPGWIPATAGLTAPAAAPLSTVSLGALIVNAKVLVVVLAVVVLGVLGAILRSPDGTEPSVDAASVEPAGASDEVATGAGSGGTGAPSAPLAEEARRSAPRARPDRPAAATPESEPAAAQRRTVRGRVVDVNDTPVTLMGLRFVPTSLGAEGEVLLKSGANGVFELETSAGPGDIVAADPRYTTVMSGHATTAASRAGTAEVETLVVVAPATAIAGRVEDEAGRPIPGALVNVTRPRTLPVELEERLDASSLRRYHTRTDEDGRFAWAEAPYIEGAELLVACEGYLSHAEPLLSVPEQRVDVVLRRPPTDEHALIGQVLDPQDRPVPGAYVALGLASTVADDRGYFQLDRRGREEARLKAVSRGFLPAVIEAPEDGWPEFVAVRLGGEPLSLRGRVVDEDGEPRPGVHVWITDPTPFSLVGEEPSHMEHLLSSSAERGGYDNFQVDGPPVAVPGEPTVGPPTAWSFAITDARGWFRIDGLMDRRYRLRAMDPKTLVQAEGEAADAGAEQVELLLPARAVHPRVAGRVVSLGGAPQPGVKVGLIRRAFEAQVQAGPSTLVASSHSRLPLVTTDEEGRFEFSDVPREGQLVLFAVADEIVPVQQFLDHEAAVDALEFEVALRLHLAVELADPTRADSFQVLDGGGRPMPVHVLRATSQDVYGSAPIVDGRSEVVVVSEQARSIRLIADGETVDTVPVQLVPGDVNTLRL